MAIATFYHPSLELDDTQLVLSKVESQHALKSRRLRVDSPIQVINGRGLLAQAVIAQSNKHEIVVSVQSVASCPKPKFISVATAIPKGDRQRNMVGMLSQLGVSQILPLQCQRSVTQFKENMTEKWQRWAIEACKQSQNPWLVDIGEPTDLESLLSNVDGAMLYADQNGQPWTALAEQAKADALMILVGPEGGFSEQELSLLERSQAAPLTLAKNILRTELASVAAVAQLQFM